jgi:hypothetical protein
MPALADTNFRGVAQEADRLAWGAAEDAARKMDIEAVESGQITLEQAKKNARRRVRASGMTPSEAYRALIDSRIEKRRSGAAGVNP